MDDKHTFARHSHDTVLPLLAAGALLAGNAFGAQPPRASGSSVATTDAAAAMQMTTDRVAGKTAAPTSPLPTPDAAEAPRVGTKPVINDEPQRCRFSHELFRSEFHNNSVASRSEHSMYSWMRGCFPLDLA
jgi:hypothetical protein